MRIVQFQVYPLPTRFLAGPFITSYGPRPTLENLAVVAKTDSGLTGFGEVGRINQQLEAPTSGAFLHDLEPILGKLLGSDPSNTFQMIDALPELPPYRSNIPAAIEGLCLDLMAQASGLPAYALLGGSRQTELPMYLSISREAPDIMLATARDAAEQGFRVFQVKIGEGVDADAERIEAVLSALDADHNLLADANGGYDPATARQLIGSVTDNRILWEEPCKTLAENIDLAKDTGGRLVLDQCLIDLRAYATACTSGVISGCGLKPTLQGGVSAARTARDMCIAHGVSLKMDDVWSLEPGTLASLNLSMGVPAPLFIAAIDQWAYFDNNLSGTVGVPPAPTFQHDGKPGLGMPLSAESLGEPVLDVGIT